jgi:hypothetical protein
MKLIQVHKLKKLIRSSSLFELFTSPVTEVKLKGELQKKPHPELPSLPLFWKLNGKKKKSDLNCSYFRK